MDGISAERQETGVIEAVKSAVHTSNKKPITIVAGKTTIKGAVDAHKFTGRQTGGSEPHQNLNSESEKNNDYI